MLPNFLIVGAEKAGTTTLAAMLAQHPEVFMCTPKEPRFFTCHNWNKGLSWYESLFRDGEGCKAIGEASPSYTWAPRSEDVPKRIYATLGNIKYIYIVRHPIDRMVSHYRHALFHRWVADGTSFEEALKEISHIKHCSRYFFQIEKYLSYTSPKQWLVLVFEELLKDPVTVQQKIYQFLGINTEIVIPLFSKNVTNQKRRMPNLYKHIRTFKYIFPAPTRQFGKRLAHKCFGKVINVPNISEKVIDSLNEELRPDVQRLSEFCGRDFASIWSFES